MQLSNEEILIFLIVAGFVASFIDSVVGGGGLIMVPAFMLAGLPPVIVLGTNKVAGVMGSFTGALAFLRSGKADIELLKILFPMSLIGSIFGVYTVQLLSPDFLRPLVVVMLVLVTLYSVLKKDWGIESTYQGMDNRKKMLSVLAIFAFGFYDGFFGPGTGSFILFSFLCIGFDFIGAAANARILNFASNISAALVFSYLGLVNFYYAIPVGIAMVFGALAGTHMALTKGATYVKPLFLTVTTALIGKQIWDLLK